MSLFVGISLPNTCKSRDYFDPEEVDMTEVTWCSSWSDSPPETDISGMLSHCALAGVSHLTTNNSVPMCAFVCVCVCVCLCVRVYLSM